MTRTTAAFLLTLIVATAALAANERDSLIVVDGNSATIDGGAMPQLRELKARYGTRFAWFRRGGVEYVSRDERSLDRLEALYQPQARIGAKQAALGQKQAALGAEQARIGERQAALGRKQARAGADQHQLAAAQSDLAAAQSELGRRQSELGEAQASLGREQELAGAEARRNLPRLLDEVIRSGLAERVK